MQTLDVIKMCANSPNTTLVKVEGRWHVTNLQPKESWDNRLKQLAQDVFAEYAWTLMESDQEKLALEHVKVIHGRHRSSSAGALVLFTERLRRLRKVVDTSLWTKERVEQSTQDFPKMSITCSPDFNKLSHAVFLDLATCQLDWNQLYPSLQKMQQLVNVFLPLTLKSLSLQTFRSEVDIQINYNIARLMAKQGRFSKKPTTVDILNGCQARYLATLPDVINFLVISSDIRKNLTIAARLTLWGLVLSDDLIQSLTLEANIAIDLSYCTLTQKGFKEILSKKPASISLVGCVAIDDDFFDFPLPENLALDLRATSVKEEKVRSLKCRVTWDDTVLPNRERSKTIQSSRGELSEEAFKALLEYILTGYFPFLTIEIAKELLTKKIPHLCRESDRVTLRSYAETFLSHNLTLANVVSIFHFAEENQLVKLKIEARYFIEFLMHPTVPEQWESVSEEDKRAIRTLLSRESCIRVRENQWDYRETPPIPKEKPQTSIFEHPLVTAVKACGQQAGNWSAIVKSLTSDIFKVHQWEPLEAAVALEVGKLMEEAHGKRRSLFSALIGDEDKHFGHFEQTLKRVTKPVELKEGLIHPKLIFGVGEARHLALVKNAYFLDLSRAVDISWPDIESHLREMPNLLNVFLPSNLTIPYNPSRPWRPALEAQMTLNILRVKGTLPTLEKPSVPADLPMPLSLDEAKKWLLMPTHQEAAEIYLAHSLTQENVIDLYKIATPNLAKHIRLYIELFMHPTKEEQWSTVPENLKPAILALLNSESAQLVIPLRWDSVKKGTPVTQGYAPTPTPGSDDL